MKAQSNLQVFVINLDKDRQRLQEFAARMKELKVHFTRWVATPGEVLDTSNFGVKPILPGVFIEEYEEWSRNEAACGVSHILLLQYIVNNKIPWSLIMEDDGVLTRTIPLEINEWNLPNDAEIVFVNNRSQYIDICYEGNHFSFGELSGGAGTDGYLISHTGARKLLTALYPLRAPLDFQIFSHCSSIQQLDHPPYYWRLPQNPEKRNILLKAYRTKDPLVFHTGDSSAIGNQRHPRAHFYCNVLLGLFFEEDKNYAYSDILIKKDIVRKNSGKERMITEWKGVDISLLDENMVFWNPYKRISQSPMQILKEFGVNLVRISLWVDPSSSLNLERALRLASKARDEGLQICLALHYSDTWADPARQIKPKAWRLLPFEELCAYVFLYTREVMEAMCQIGCQPAIVQLGNEVTNGILWEELGNGRANQTLLYDHEWLRFSTLMHHANRGVRDVIKNEINQTKILLHLDNGTKQDKVVWWFSKAETYEIDFDMIGLSFYPLTHNGLSLKNIEDFSILNIHFPDKEIMLVETAYPYRKVYDIHASLSQDNPPFSTDGQLSYLREVIHQMRKISNNAGICWWGAFFINDSIEQCPYFFSSQALFDRNGVALPALTAFME